MLACPIVEPCFPRGNGQLIGSAIAYGDAAAIVLEFAVKPTPKLCTLVAYYPTALPHVGAGFPPSLNVVVHLAGSQGMGPKYHSYAYPHAETGFAEEDLETYDKVSANLAWTRTLAAVRKGFGIEVDLESVWEEHLACEYQLPYG